MRCIQASKPALLFFDFLVHGRIIRYSFPHETPITVSRRPSALALIYHLFSATRVIIVTAQLTVLIPCKDERRNIRACIESVQAIADEILVADSGSTDGTLDIVRDIGGCRIIER